MECTLALGSVLPDGFCYLCGNELSGRRRRWCSTFCVKMWYQNHNWNGARRAAKRRDKYACVKCGSKFNLEVNHIAPIFGAGYTWSCRNHLSNLETLCHRCHVAVTNQQRKDRNGLPNASVQHD